MNDRGFDDMGFGVHQFSAALAARGLPAPDLILHSPWVRTRQTAEIVASAFARARCRELAALRPAGTVKTVESAVAALEETSPGFPHVVLVSHQPLVSQLVEYFLAETGAVPSLSPGALATLELTAVARACGTLRFWSMPPEYQAGI